MNKSQIIALYDQDQRKDVEYPDTRREVTPNLVRHINTSGTGEGTIIYSQLNEANVEDTIRQQVNYFESIGQDFEWKVYDYDRPPDLKERLASYGFIVEEAEAIMVLDLEDAPEILWGPVRHNVQRILDPEKISDILAIEEEVWGEDFSSLGHYLVEALSHYPERMSVYLAYIDEQPVSTAWIYFPEHSRFASLWGGSTLSAFRGQGLYTALLAMRAQEAKARQVSYLTVDASPMSRPTLEKFGFEMIAWSYPCKWKRKSQKQGAVP
ncbi:MAG: GNAT family N-acetyltransferase [Anaerolineales bacterium]